MIRVLEIYNRCFIDILSVSWRYLIGVLEIFDGLSWRHLMGVLEIIDRCPGDI